MSEPNSPYSPSAVFAAGYIPHPDIDNALGVYQPAPDMAAAAPMANMIGPMPIAQGGSVDDFMPIDPRLDQPGPSRFVQGEDQDYEGHPRRGPGRPLGGRLTDDELIEGLMRRRRSSAPSPNDIAAAAAAVQGGNIDNDGQARRSSAPAIIPPVPGPASDADNGQMLREEAIERNNRTRYHNNQSAKRSRIRKMIVMAALADQVMLRYWKLAQIDPGLARGYNTPTDRRSSGSQQNPSAYYQHPIPADAPNGYSLGSDHRIHGDVTGEGPVAEYARPLIDWRKLLVFPDTYVRAGREARRYLIEAVKLETLIELEHECHEEAVRVVELGRRIREEMGEDDPDWDEWKPPADRAGSKRKRSQPSDLGE